MSEVHGRFCLDDLVHQTVPDISQGSVLPFLECSALRFLQKVLFTLSVFDVQGGMSLGDGRAVHLRSLSSCFFLTPCTGNVFCLPLLTKLRCAWRLTVEDAHGSAVRLPRRSWVYVAWRVCIVFLFFSQVLPCLFAGSSIHTATLFCAFIRMADIIQWVSRRFLHFFCSPQLLLSGKDAHGVRPYPQE